MQHKIDNKLIYISEAQSTSKTNEPNHSFVILTIDGKELILASHHYKKSNKTKQLYADLNIKFNVDLLEIPHGTDEDIPELTIPRFQDSANLINHYLTQHNKVLINCHNGRSRTGAVTAMFLMDYCGFTAQGAILVVKLCLKARGYNGGLDIKGGIHGTYADWLLKYENQKNRDLNKENIEVQDTSTRKSKRLAEKPRFFASKAIKLSEIDLNSATNHNAFL